MHFEVISEDGETGYFRLRKDDNTELEAGIFPVPSPFGWFRAVVDNQDIDKYPTFAEARAALEQYAQDQPN